MPISKTHFMFNIFTFKKIPFMDTPNLLKLKRRF